MKKKSDKVELLWSIIRIFLGLIFLWAFFDKLIGLGFATCLNSETGNVDILCDSSWVKGGSPTFGFLNFATKGPFATLFSSLAGNGVVDWLFMLGLAGIGLTLTFGFAIRAGSFSGVILMLLMWSSVLPPEHHPFLDEHIVYLFVLLSFIFKPAKEIGISTWWNKLGFVRKRRWLQ